MRILRALGLYAALTVALTWPMALRLRIMDPGDSAYFAWEVAWEIHALKTGWSTLPHANIYHPARYTLGMDEPVLGTMLLALPLSLFTDDAVLLFNLARLLTFLLSALAASLLARELGCGEGTALFAGAAFAFSPIRTDQLAHLSTLGTQWLPLVLLFLFRFARTGKPRDALLSALFFVLTAYACGYYGLIGLLVLPPAALLVLWGRWRLFPAAILSAALAGAALLPLQALHRKGFEAEGFTRHDAEAVFHSASLESFLATSSWNWLYGEITTPFRTLGSNNLFPGLVIPGLIAVGAASLARRRERPTREALALAALAALAAVVALGPEVRAFDRTLVPGPFGWVRAGVPMFQAIRVTGRAGTYMALALALLAARSLEPWAGRRGVLALVGTAALVEALIVPIPMPAWAQVVDTRRPPPPVYTWLAAQPGEFAVVELPIVESRGFFPHPAYDESIYMVYSTLHWKRLVNGGAGVEPAPYRRVRSLARRFPSAECLQALGELEVRYVVLHRRGFGPNQWRRIERDLPSFTCCLKPVATFADVTVFELAGAGSQ